MPARTGIVGNFDESATKSSPASGARCHVDQRRDSWIIAYVADDRTAPRVRDQYGRSVLLGENAAGLRDGVGERGQRVLHRGHVQVRCLESRYHRGPARAVGPRSVYEDDIARDDWAMRGSCIWGLGADCAWHSVATSRLAAPTNLAEAVI